MESFDSVNEQPAPYTPKPPQVPDYVSEADYWKFYYSHPDENYEWNNGKLEVKPMGDYLSHVMYSWFFRLLEEYLEVYREGITMGGEIGFILNWQNRKSIRKPDLAVICKNNPTSLELLDRTYKGTCDICIEFLSDSTRQEMERDTIVKKEEYAKVGVQEYFILDRLHKHTAFYYLPQTQSNQPLEYKPMDPGTTGIIRSQVLPQFAFRLEHLKTHPQLSDLIEDPVYQPYVRKDLQQANQLTAQEKEAKEKERLAKEKALQDTEKALQQSTEERQAKEALQADLEKAQARIKQLEAQLKK